MFMSHYAMRKQTGATLIVSLVILAVVTILGIASIRSSNLELKMAASQRDRSVAFQTAETAIKLVQQKLTSPKVFLDQLKSGCGTGDYCFQANCSKAGYCFGGLFDGTGFLDECRMANDLNVVPQYWQNQANWDKAPTIEVPNASDPDTNNPVKYLVEFMCFVSREDSNVSGQTETRNDMLPLFRISVLAKGEAQRSTVMLQTVFRGVYAL